jgi:hypothetical protein
MRTALSIGVQLLNAPYREQPVYITTATSLGFNAALIESDGGACPAGQLMMTSFSGKLIPPLNCKPLRENAGQIISSNPVLTCCPQMFQAT